eukprot:1138647-Pelagomonas_calceolata.AAC.3
MQLIPKSPSPLRVKKETGPCCCHDSISVSEGARAAAWQEAYLLSSEGKKAGIKTCKIENGHYSQCLRARQRNGGVQQPQLWLVRSWRAATATTALACAQIEKSRMDQLDTPALAPHPTMSYVCQSAAKTRSGSCNASLPRCRQQRRQEAEVAMRLFRAAYSRSLNLI